MNTHPYNCPCEDCTFALGELLEAEELLRPLASQCPDCGYTEDRFVPTCPNCGAEMEVVS